VNLSPDTFDKVRGDSDSLAGLILELSREIPKVNDVIPAATLNSPYWMLTAAGIKKVKVAIKLKTL